MKKNLLAAIFFLSATLLPIFVSAQSLDEAKRMFNDGDYEDALEILVATADKEPKNTAVNHMAGVALQRLGHIEEAKKYLAKGTNESNINLAEIAFLEYRFDEADELLDKYEKALKKAKKTAQPAEEALAVREKIQLGRSMIERVEKIVIIDSIAVDKDDFFRAYRIAASAGSLNGIETLPKGMKFADPLVVYTTENGRYKIWSAPDSEENYVLMESTLLDDGKWSQPQQLPGDLNDGGDANFPFLLNDGETLYFANDGENSLGGYDIFISRRDDDGYSIPQNLGMPYNSPYDDYLLVIDEETGSGWWATDRNRIEDKITIYRFIPSEFRSNYPSETDDLADRAFARDFRQTQNPATDYDAIVKRMDALTVKQKQKQREFTFGLPGGRIYTSLQDFKNPTARNLMTEYIALQRKLSLASQRLDGMRAEYRKGKKNLSIEIETAESDIEAMRNQLKSLKNDIVRAEK